MRDIALIDSKKEKRDYNIQCPDRFTSSDKTACLRDAMADGIIAKYEQI